jgi:hypothetical protein
MKTNRGEKAPVIVVSLLAPAVALVGLVTLFAAPPGAIALGETATQLTTMLADLRPDSHLFVREIRRIPRTRFPVTHYMALVRPGGVDPLDPGDAPRSGRKNRNDILFYPDTFGLERSPAWRLLLLDHEYLHAKHLSGAHDVPLVSFGSLEVDRHFFEAVAWSHNLAEARQGAYGELTPRDLMEVQGNLERHLKPLRRHIDRKQPSAWLYYAGFFADPEGRPENAVASVAIPAREESP